MSEGALPSNSSAAEETGTLPKRRKIRKGTQSCWECKRRKIRCTFATPTEATCDGCRSRRTPCTSQEYYDEPALASRKPDRLSRMESLVEQLVERNVADTPSTLHQNQSDRDKDTEPVQDYRDVGRGTSSRLPQSNSTTADHLDLESQVTDSFDELSRALLAAWPKQHDLDLILSVPVGVSVLFHGIVCMPYSRFFSKQISSPRRMLQPPPQGAHPVTIARRLLMLGALLQGVPPCSVGELVGLSSDYRDIMSRVVRTATRLVTSNDELLGSLDGIECVMIESMYLNNAGNLRCAWLTNRRAMAIAQTIGLHTSTSSLSLILEADTRGRIDPDCMWFRLVCSDRYLSLMLGLPQGSLGNTFASPTALEGCTAMERMERMESVAAGLILQRNSIEQTDFATTSKIDQMLREAAALMPPKWWLMTPDLAAFVGNDAKAFEETIRLMLHFAHHHLLVQLHLPYMMRPSSTYANYDYSKMTAASASRAIVTQFVSFRNSILATAYCRGIDFVAFIASTTLCVAHIEARRQHQTDGSRGASVFQSLQHQRLNDRAWLERTLEIMETMAQSHDIVALKISSILQPLLAIEHNSAKGACYHTSALSETDEQEYHCLDRTNESVDVLRIHIPYFGTIRIKHHSLIHDTVGSAQTLNEECPRNTSGLEAIDASLVVLREPVSLLNQEQDMEYQGELVSGAHMAGYVISSAEPVNTDWQTVPFYLDPPDLLQRPRPVNWDESTSSLDISGGQEARLLVPGLATTIHDWALQGVDTALFHSLTQGSAESSVERPWTHPDRETEE